MDPREGMAMPGSASYYMQRGMSGLQVSPNIHPLGNAGVPFQSNVGGGSVVPTIPLEPSSSISPHGVNFGTPSIVSSIEPVRRKRGRPRKYGPDGSVSLGLSPSSTPPVKLSPIQKRGRGRPPGRGSGRKQQLPPLGHWLSGSTGMGFTPHVITIAVGEDVTTKIMSFSQQGSRAICVLSAIGAISTACLQQASSSMGTVTYEGRFEILCLSGMLWPSDNGGSRGRSGGLNISLAGPDGRVIGGGVGGMLVAASPVQVILGSFLLVSSKTKDKAGESEESAEDSERQTVENPVSQGILQLGQNLTPSSSVGGVWPGSQPLDVQSAHVDIDLMRGDSLD